MKKYGQVYRKMLLVYVLILLIPVLISVLLYQYTYNLVFAQADLYNKNMITTVRSACDSELKYYYSYVERIKTDANVRSLWEQENISDRQTYYREKEVQKLFSDMKNAMNEEMSYNSDIFVYVKKSDRIIGGYSIMDYDLYSDYYEGTIGRFRQDAERVRDVLQNLKSREMISVTTDNGREYILILEPILGMNGRKGNLVVGVWISKSVLETQVQSVNWDGEIEWGLLDEEGNILRAPQKITEFNSELVADKKMPEKMKISGKDYHVYAEESEVCGSYILFTPSEQISYTADRIRNLHLISLVAILLIGFWLARRAMKLSYDPLKDILMFFREKDESEPVVNEFKYLERKVSALLEKHDSAEQTVKSSKKLIRNYVLERLLLSSPAEGEETQDTKDIFDKFRKGKNVVLVFGITENKRPGRKEIVNDNELKRFVIGNVLSEGIGEVYAYETLEYDEHVIMIINLPEGVQKEPNTLANLADKYCGFIAEHFSFAVYTLEGGAYQGIAGIHKSYLEACQAEGFCTDLNENYVSYDEIKDRTVRKYQYSFELEEKVINAVRTHNAELAISYIDSVLEMNFKQKERTNAEMLTCLIYDIFTTLVKASEEVGIGFNRMPAVSQISSGDSIQEIQTYFRQIVNEVCTKAERIAENEQKDVLSEKVKEYIEKNFTDQGLNISQIALQFFVTPAYLSTLFKKQTGESILSVLKQRRVEYAKTLLENGVKVTEVAEKSGFSDLSTFIRTFKTYTGTTPGQIKKIDKN